MNKLYVKILGFFNLTPSDVVSILKGAAIAAIGAAINYAIKYLSGHDYGIGGAIVMAVLANIVRKGVDGPVQQKTGITI